MPTVKSSLGDGTQSVLLTATILERLADENRPLSISKLAREIDASKSRIFRHLQTLVSCDFVAQDQASGGYLVGSRFLQICSKLNRRYDLLTLAMPILHDLRRHTNHTTIVSRVDAAGVHVIKSIAADSLITLDVRVGTTLPFDRSAQGLVALAFTDPDRREGTTPLSQAYRDYSASHPGDLSRIAERGWASAGMREGLIGKAAPVRGEDGRIVATLALLDTADSMSGTDDADTAHLLAAARRLSLELGRGGYGQD